MKKYPIAMLISPKTKRELSKLKRELEMRRIFKVAREKGLLRNNKPSLTV